MATNVAIQQTEPFKCRILDRTSIGASVNPALIYLLVLLWSLFPFWGSRRAFQFKKWERQWEHDPSGLHLPQGDVVRIKRILDCKFWHVLLEGIVQCLDLLLVVKFVKHQRLNRKESQRAERPRITVNHRSWSFSLDLNEILNSGMRSQAGLLKRLLSAVIFICTLHYFVWECIVRGNSFSRWKVELKRVLDTNGYEKVRNSVHICPLALKVVEKVGNRTVKTLVTLAIGNTVPLESSAAPGFDRFIFPIERCQITLSM